MASLPERIARLETDIKAVKGEMKEMKDACIRRHDDLKNDSKDGRTNVFAIVTLAANVVMFMLMYFKVQ